MSSCAGCAFYAKGYCRRYPAPQRAHPDHWCGEFKSSGAKILAPLSGSFFARLFGRKPNA